MRKIFGIIAILTISASAMASDAKEFGFGLKKGDKETTEGIQFFHGTWEEALKASDKENKLIFLDAYAHWCGPCKIMASKTFTDKEVGDFFNANFINYKMDMEKHEDGPRLSRKYGLTAYPTLYFINGKENVVYQTLGYHKPNQLIAVGEEVLKK